MKRLIILGFLVATPVVAWGQGINGMAPNKIETYRVCERGYWTQYTTMTNPMRVEDLNRRTPTTGKCPRDGMRCGPQETRLPNGAIERKEVCR